MTLRLLLLLYLVADHCCTHRGPLSGKGPSISPLSSKASKNDIVTVKIDRQSLVNGDGIAKIIDKATNRPCELFIPNTVAGDEVQASILKIASDKAFGFGKLQKVIKSSKYRVDSVCAVADRCGGCQLLHQTYRSQLDIKNDIVRVAFASYPSLKHFPIERVIAATATLNYRNKVQFSIQRNDRGSIDIGLYAVNSQQAVDTKYCHIQHNLVNDILKQVRYFLAKNSDVSIYNPAKKVGSLCHLVIRVGFHTNEAMVCLVSNTKYKDLVANAASKTKGGSGSSSKSGGGSSKGSGSGGSSSSKGSGSGCGSESEFSFSHLQSFKDSLSSVPGVKCVLYNYNPAPMDADILGDEKTEKTQLLSGESEYIHDTVAGVRVRVSLLSFMQSNPLQAEILYRKVAEVAVFTGNETVLDLYCGVGTISLFVAPLVKKVIGVEDCAAAVVDALENKRINNIENVDFICGKAEDVLSVTTASGKKTRMDDVVAHDGDDEEKEEEELFSPDLNPTPVGGYFPERVTRSSSSKYANIGGVVVVSDDMVAICNPPRKGCEQRLLAALVERAVRKIVYVSCNPKTLSRDLDILIRNGYSLDKVCPVDMFPHTTHVEVVCLLSAPPL